MASVECAAVFDVASVVDELTRLSTDCDWPMLVNGQQRLSNRDFANAAQILNEGTYSLTVLSDLLVDCSTKRTMVVVS